MTRWSDHKKYRLESARTVVFATVGLLVSLYVVQKLDEHGLRDAHLAKERLRIQQEVVDDFLISSYAYSSQTYDLIKTPYGKSLVDDVRQWPPTIRNWDEDFYQPYRNDLNRIRTYFARELGQNPLVNELLNDGGVASKYFKDRIEGKPNKKIAALIEKYRSDLSVQSKYVDADWENARQTFKHVNNQACTRLLSEIGLLEPPQPRFTFASALLWGLFFAALVTLSTGVRYIFRELSHVPDDNAPTIKSIEVAREADSVGETQDRNG